MEEKESADDLWDLYLNEGSAKAREELILMYSPLVKFVVGRMINDFPSYISAEDLTSNGLFGLIKAVETFNPNLGYKFETYASIKIKGSIIDELRTEDSLPRSVRTKSKTIRQYREEMLNQGHGLNKIEDMVEKTGLSKKQIYTTEKVVNQSHQLSLNAQVSLKDGIEVGDFTETLNPEQSELETYTGEDSDFESLLESDALMRLIVHLGEEEKIVIALRYYQGYNFQQVGEILNIKENTCRRRHDRTLKKLKEIYTEQL